MLKTKVRSLLVTVCLIASLCAIVVQTQPMTRQDKSKQDHTRLPDPESLPPDTFRQLAQVLYHKVENRLTRRFFDNSSVTCNDGSVAGYYIRPNYHSKRWIIFLEGKEFEKNRKKSELALNILLSFKVEDSAMTP